MKERRFSEMDGGGEVERVAERLEKSLCVEPEDKQEAYARFVAKGKNAARSGDFAKALDLFKRAYKLHPTEKLKSRIEKIQELLSEQEDDEFVDVCASGLSLFKGLEEKLYQYQKQGVAFLYSLYRDKRWGGILADDMGLGKTIQVISFLSGMYDAEHVRCTLLVMPMSLITNWTSEFAKWTPGMRVKEFHGTSKTERMRNLEKIQRRGGVLVTTYNMLLHNWQLMATYRGAEFTWDYMILDEAHKIKSSSTKTAKSASAIPSKNRLLLTGTPVQNNLREMWALFDFACQGALLGTAKTFKAEYENPITRAREKDATPGEKALGSRMSENLMDIIKPYFLRRTKADVQKSKLSTSPQRKNAGDSEASDKRQESSGAVIPKLTRKNDLIVWTYLSQVQENIYKQFLSLDEIKELLMTTRSPLAQLNVLKKLCDHPRLLSARAMSRLGLDEPEEEESDSSDDISGIPDQTLLSESGKMVFLFSLLERLREEGHRTLVFAHYRRVLDIIERILNNRGFKVMRLDGTISQTAERQRRITCFQEDCSCNVFLLTTQVGGVGLTLTAASRVVIYDPSWNPATDAQAVDRAYRIGQKDNVVIYRLITCGTVEEKIYRRQVFKDSLIRQNTGDKKNPFRYFSKQELRELFSLGDTRSSTTQLQLQALHARQRRTDPELDEHIAHLYTMDMFGISDHDLMFSVNVHQEEAPQEEEHHYIEGRVQKARELVAAESRLQTQLAQSMVSSTEGAWLRMEAHPPQERKRSREVQKPDRAPPAGHVIDLEPDMKDLDQSVIDLERCSVKEDPSVMEDSVEVTDVSLKLEQSASDKATADFQDACTDGATVEEEMDRSTHGDNSTFFTADDSEKLGGSGGRRGDQKSSVLLHSSPLIIKPPSALQISSKSESSFKSSKGPDSFRGEFHLQLDDSDMFSDENIFNDQVKTEPEKGETLADQQPGAEPELDEDRDMFLDEEQTETEQRQILSRLRLERSFNVDKSLAEFHLSEDKSAAGDISSMNEPIPASKRKKRFGRIESGDEEEEEEEERGDNERFEASLNVLASTPKQNRSMNSREGNTSVASRRSMVLSLIEDDEEDEEDSGDMEEEGSYKEERDESSAERIRSEQEEDEPEQTQEENGLSSREDAFSGEEVEEEPSGETLNSEEQESVEQSTGDAELSSNEQMEEFTAADGVTEAEEAEPKGEEVYDWLVQRGREHVHRGQRDEALKYFLRAIDMKPGDVEIQLLTIQLYRQLSQK